jgi:hypothetical protein
MTFSNNCLQASVNGPFTRSWFFCWLARFDYWLRDDRMRPSTLGGWIGLGASLSGGGATVIWPDHKEVAWGIFLAGLILFLGSLVWWVVANYTRIPWIANRIRTPWAERKNASRGPATPERMGILEIYKVAKDKYGWSFENGSLHYGDLIYGLRRAGMYGEIRFWGKRNRHRSEALTRDEVSVHIAPAHWLGFDLDLWEAIAADDNFYARSLNKRDFDELTRGGFADIHADRAEAYRWLETGAHGYKGHTERMMHQFPGLSSLNLHSEGHLTS